MWSLFCWVDLGWLAACGDSLLELVWVGSLGFFAGLGWIGWVEWVGFAGMVLVNGLAWMGWDGWGWLGQDGLVG